MVLKLDENSDGVSLLLAKQKRGSDALPHMPPSDKAELPHQLGNVLGL